jgi:sRNA-binding carbon storage regulator CsrA
MLVLQRNHGESVSLFHRGVFIGRVTLDQKGPQTRLAFDFDKETRIVRDEVLDAERMKDVSVPALV